MVLLQTPRSRNPKILPASSAQLLAVGIFIYQSEKKKKKTWGQGHLGLLREYSLISGATGLEETILSLENMQQQAISLQNPPLIIGSVPLGGLLASLSKWLSWGSCAALETWARQRWDRGES